MDIPVKLERIEEFKEVLHGYQPSGEVRSILEQTPLVIMLGITGGGRNTIINHLVGSNNYYFIISDTTRPPKMRDGRLEQDGVQYNFRSEEKVLQDLRDGNFIEAELIHNQQVSGISIGEFEKAIKSGKIPVNEIEIGGTRAIRALKPDTYFFFVVPPSYKEWMYRLAGREVMSQEELDNRLRTARIILEDALQEGFTFVINDSSHATADRIDRAVRAGEKPDDTEARSVAREILAELQSK